MDNSINRIYIGLPDDLIEKVFWIAPPFRTNPLSQQFGGCDVIVEYVRGSVYGYDWVHYPSSYIKTIMLEEFRKVAGFTPDIKEPKQLEMVKKIFARIFARNYQKPEKFETAMFDEVWNSKTSSDMPETALLWYDRPKPLW